MSKYNLQNSFLEFCKVNKFEINTQQVKIINLLNKFIFTKKLFSLFFPSKKKICFYLHGNVGVGKTMLLNFVYDRIKIKKLRLHFNEFMINFYDFKHKFKNENTIKAFAKELKNKYDLIYLDEFQVTNIVDAMILGKLFEIIFLENIKIIITANTKLNELYKDGLQREKFLPFIKIIKKYSIQKELLLDNDYRQSNKDNSKRIFFPINEKTSFKINQNFRELTRNETKEKKTINTKGRKFIIEKFYNGIARFKFDELCDVIIGAEEYINISKLCNHIFIEEIPIFNNDNSNQQLRFITLIDILYEKKIALTLSLTSQLKNLSSSKKNSEVFKRTLSRLAEMTRKSQLY